MSTSTPLTSLRLPALLAGCSLLALLGGCAIPPASIDLDSAALRNRDRLQSTIAQAEPVNGSISLYEAMARALKYNLDERIEAMDQVLRAKQVELRRHDLLPQVVVSSGYSRRSNDAGGRSRSLLSGNESLEPSTSSEREAIDAQLTASWDVLDYGLARVRVMQGANELAIAGERRRKVINRIVEDVRTAYWRAVSADRTLAKLGEVEDLARTALSQSEQLEKRRVVSPMVVLTFQRDLLQVQGEVQRLRRELTLAKNQLAALMNLPPQADFDLVLPDRTDLVPELPGSADDMVLVGLRYRAELREAAYRRNSTELEQHATLLRALPSVKGLLGLNTDSNAFLYNSNWLNASARVSWNLLSVFRYRAGKAAFDAEVSVLDQRDLALTMAVTTQVHVARLRFLRLAQELATARQTNTVQLGITKLRRAGFSARTISRQQLVREELNAVLAEIRYDTAFADMQNAYANLYSSMGLDNFNVDTGPNTTLAQLAQALERHWGERASSLPETPALKGAL